MKLEGKSLKHDFFRFIIPSLMAQWVYALYTMIDGMFVARGVSELALSGVNIAMPFVTLLFSVALIFAVGSSTIIAIYLGQKKHQQANEVFTQNMISAAIVSLLITAIVLAKSQEISLFLGATDATIEYVETYIRTIAKFSIFFIGAYSLEVLIKTDGYPTKATIFVTIGAVLNCLLDYIFVIHLDLGVWGAAFATGVSQLTVTILYLTHFFSSKTNMKLVKFRPQFRQTYRTLQLGFSSGITEFSPGIVIFMFNHFILRYINEEAIVSYTIVTYVSTIIIMSMMGIAQGIQPLVSYYYGKNKPEKYKKLLKYALVFGTLYSILAFFISRGIASPLVNVFISDSLPHLRIQSVEIFRTFSYSFLLCGANIILSGYFSALEHPVAAMTISICRGFLFVAFSLQLLTSLIGGEGIWYAATLAEALCLVLTFFICLNTFRKKTKTNNEPIPPN